MTTVNDDLIREFLAEEARRVVDAAPSLDTAVRRLVPQVEALPSGASRRLIVLLAATLLLVAAIGTALAVGISLLRLPTVLDNPEFAGEWAAANYNDYVGADTSSQRMTVRAGEDGVFDITMRDDFSFECSDTPMTMTGTGRLEDPSTLVVTSPVLACVDGSEPTDDGLSRMEEAGSYALVLDLATDRLYDSLGVVWNRGDAPERGAENSTQAHVDERGTFSILHGEVTFHADPPWGAHPEAYIDPRLFFLVGPGHTAAAGSPQAPSADMTILVNPLAPKAPCGSLRVPPSAEELVQAIRSNPDLEATVPVTERVGRIDALQMDVVAAPGGSIGPCGAVDVDVVYVPGRAWGGVGPGDLGRIYVLDLPGGSARTLAILITAPDADLFQRALDTAAPVLDSFDFHAP